MEQEHTGDGPPAGSASPASSGTGSQPSGELEYDCSPWAQETRQILRSLVAESGIPHAWEGTVLVVPGAFEERADELVEAAMATARSALGTAREKVAYEVSLWSAASQNRLVDSLVEQRVPHEWDAEGDLVVHAEDAEELEALIDDLGEPDGSDDLDGLELHERLGELFMATDRLCRDPHDTKAARAVGKTLEELGRASLPFGVEPELWLRLHRQGESLLGSLEGDEVPEPADTGDADGDDEGGAHGESDGVARRAEALRDLLRSFV